MKPQDKCPTCLRLDRNSPASIRQSLESDVETWQAEAARLAARVAELEAREKQRAEDEAWAGGMGGIRIRIDGAKWNIHHHDCRRFGGSFEAFSTTISGALRALREKMEAKP